MKKLALIISGLAYVENKINFTLSILNYKEYIYAYFLNLGILLTRSLLLMLFMMIIYEIYYYKPTTQ